VPHAPACLVLADRVFTADPEHPWAEAVVLAEGRVRFAGSRGAAVELAGRAAEVIDATGGTVVPGFVDAHAHIIETGESLTRAQLRDAYDLTTILDRLVAWSVANPEAERVLGIGWMFSSLPGGQPHRSHLDIAFAKLPVYLDASDLHSTWVNTAALHELGITDDTPDPIGGRIVRDATGRATGLLLETASFALVPPVIGRVDDVARDRHLAAAIRAYNESGVTAAVDMALENDAFAAMKRAATAGEMTLKIAAHWMIHRSGSTADELAQVHRAAERFHETRADAFLRVVGVKLMVDGTIDGCTATMRGPYADGSMADPIWDDESLRRVVNEADRLGMQIAIHAIGDAAVHSARNTRQAPQDRTP
jgi:predicted amidohydrolase YtcJ